MGSLGRFLFHLAFEAQNKIGGDGNLDPGNENQGCRALF